VPEIRPFRALRYREEVVGPVAAVLSPPYDIVSPDLERRLLERHPQNVIRLELPATEPGDEPEDRYRRAARTLAMWRSDGTLGKDPRPSVYVYEQAYRDPATAEERTTRGFFARIRLEPFGAGVLPHERTLSEPKEDRYRLLRATGTNLSPVVGLYPDASGLVGGLLAAIAGGPAEVEASDDDGVRHRLWVVPAAGRPDGRPTDVPEELVRIAGSSAITIADGHHRYETALRYRDERRMTRSCEEDPAFDYILALLLDTSQRLTVLPTHRVVKGLGDAGIDDLLTRVGELFVVEPSTAEATIAAMATAGPSGGGRMGLVTRAGSVVLHARRDAFTELLPAGGDALRGLDVSLLAVALARLAGLGPDDLAGGSRVAYTKSAPEAAAWVSERVDGADAAFLLDPTPVDDIAAVARDGDVMPQKSTYFYPKPQTGLVINPHEW
jgi:uncharacterized protein (DUF1015 family)